MTMCDSGFPESTAFTFLDHLQREFTSKYKKSQIDKAIRYGFNEEFKEKLKSMMIYFNENKAPCEDNVARLKEGVLAYKNEVLEAAGK